MLRDYVEQFAREVIEDEFLFITRQPHNVSATVTDNLAI